VFTAYEPHPKDHIVKFINFEDDGFEVKKHLGLVETERAKDRRSYMLDCWRGKITNAPSKFMVTTTTCDTDEWIHSFYYYNDEIPTEQDFINSIADYLTFEFSMIAHGRGYLFEPTSGKNAGADLRFVVEDSAGVAEVLLPLNQADWREFVVGDYFSMSSGRENNMDALKPGKTPLISAKKTDNGLKAFVSADVIKQGGVITWNKDGDGGAGIAFYQPSEFAADSHILVLTPKIPISRYACLFIKTSLSQYYGIFGHGRANSMQRASRAKMMLPAAADGEPDWAYVEQYIREQEDKLIQEYREFDTPRG
jgi:hypothetical protein